MAQESQAKCSTPMRLVGEGATSQHYAYTSIAPSSTLRCYCTSAQHFISTRAPLFRPFSAKLEQASPCWGTGQARCKDSKESLRGFIERRMRKTKVKDGKVLTKGWQKRAGNSAPGKRRKCHHLPKRESGSCPAISAQGHTLATEFCSAAVFNGRRPALHLPQTVGRQLSTVNK